MQSTNTAQKEISRTVPDPVSSPFDGDSLPSITIRNNTGERIVYVFLKPVSSVSWGHDRLGQLEIFDNRDSISFTLDQPLGAENRYDLRLRDVEGTEYIKRNVIVATDSIFVFGRMDIANWAE
jgi:hypothetical protein